MSATRARRPRRTEALSKEVIVAAATEILDADGERGLTFRALTQRLGTGYGAVYHHVADKDDLLAEATRHVVDAALRHRRTEPDPSAALRVLAAGLFDAIAAHPWVGSELGRRVSQPPVLDVYESIGSSLHDVGVPDAAVFDAAGVLVNYILGVAGQNAANARAARAGGAADRATSLAGIAARWGDLDPAAYPSVRNAGVRLVDHDDRAQFLAGIDLILAGIHATLVPRRRTASRKRSGS